MIIATLVTSGSVIASVLAYSVRNALRPAGKPELADTWHEGGPL